MQEYTSHQQCEVSQFCKSWGLCWMILNVCQRSIHSPPMNSHHTAARSLHEFLSKTVENILIYSWPIWSTFANKPSLEEGKVSRIFHIISCLKPYLKCSWDDSLIGTWFPQHWVWLSCSWILTWLWEKDQGCSSHLEHWLEIIFFWILDTL